jgi:hypothetical protein
VWVYDHEAKIQRLERLVALCPACHEVKHAGLASKRGRLEAVIDHLADVNGWATEGAEPVPGGCLRTVGGSQPSAMDPRHFGAHNPLQRPHGSGERPRDPGAGAGVIHGDARNLPLPDESVDLING